MKNKFVLFLFLVLAIVIIAFINLNLPNQTKTQSQNQQKSKLTVSYQSQSDEKGEVVVEAVPTKLSTRENSEFTIKFTTHSVDLNYDLKNIAILTDDKGNQYKALSWTGGKGGHHLSGVLSFPSISKETKSVTLTISQIDNFDRVFSWSLNYEK